jgi:hypothetical protein
MYEVVEVEVASQAKADLAGENVIVQINLLVLDRAPEPSGEDIICGSATTVHADLSTCGH